MKKFSYEEIVQQALALANLENSSFIADYENINMVNSAWQDLYQKSINAGETRWLKTVPVIAKAMTLPKDFYQLYSIQDISKKEQILRANKYNFYSRSYRIVNDKLVMENASITTKFLANKYKVFDSETWETGNTDISVVNPIWCVEKTVVNPSIVKEGESEAKKYLTTTTEILKADGTTSVKTEVEMETPDSGVPYTIIKKYILSGDTKYYYFYKNPMDKTNNFDFSEDITADANIQISYFPEPKKIIPFASFTDADNEIYELDYPNNVFYTALIYKLAIYYLVKQKEDSSVMTSLYMDALQTYYDTLTSDVNQMVRITNVNAGE